MGVNELMIGNFVYGKTDTGLVVGKIDHLLQIHQGEVFVGLIGDDGNDYRGKVDDTYNCIEPIPITEEFLEKNGFKVDEVITKLCDENYYAKGINECAITIHQGSNTIGREWGIHIDNDACCTIAAADIQYVHQLQNLLNIMNIKFDIVL